MCICKHIYNYNKINIYHILKVFQLPNNQTDNLSKKVNNEVDLVDFKCVSLHNRYWCGGTLWFFWQSNWKI